MKKIMVPALIVWALASFTMVHGAVGQENGNQGTLSREELAAQINRKIQDYVFYGVYDYVVADVSDGVVRLSGWAHEQWIADQLTKKISRMEGVKTVDNQIQQVFGSEDLARRAVRAIYSDGLFEKYSFTSNPPIHVVVSNNQIILAGKVANEAERNRAAFLVDFKVQAMTIDNQLQLINH